MKIYVGIPQEADVGNITGYKQKMAEQLKRYYGGFTVDSIQFWRNNTTEISVYIMDAALYSGQDEEIISVVETLTKRYYPSNNCIVRLNYSQFDPSFDPCADSNTVEPSSQNTTSSSKTDRTNEFDYEKLSEIYQSRDPKYNFDQVILPDSVRQQILEAVATIKVESKVFDEWGLRSIIPNASSAISFYGPPGTGKSMAAEAVAQYLGQKILCATYADIESKFLGEGPKMVKAVFRAAERDNAVLFLDESDSLLSKRITNVSSDSTAQAINSMRSQLLVCLEEFKGIVIFATNLVVNYDKAFLSRLINVQFIQPEANARKAIWHEHLMGPGLTIPLSENINLDDLAEKYEFCGREIRNSVKDACVTVAMSNRSVVSQEDLLKAAEKTRTESEKVLKAEDHTKASLSDEQKNTLVDAMQKKLDSAPEKSLDEISKIT